MTPGDPPEGSLLDQLSPIALVRLVLDEDEGGVVLLDANQLALGLLGHPLAELKGHRFAALLFPDDVERVVAAVAAAVDAPGAPVIVRWRRLAPVQTLELRFQRLTAESVLVSMVDRSDQFRIDSIVCGAGSGVFTTDLDRRVTWMSPMTEAVLGIPPEAFVGIDLATLVHPEDQAALLRSIEEIEEHPGTEVVRSYRLRHPLIEDTWWRVRTSSTWLPDDPVVGGVVNRVQLTLEPARAAATPEEAMTLAELSPSGALMSASGRLTFRNDLARRWMGPFVDDDDDEGWVEALRPVHRQAVRDALRRAAGEGLRGSTTAALDRPGQATVWLQIETAPAIDGSGHVVGYVATLLDVTRDTETREQLQRAQAQLWQLANHDPLTGLPNRMQFSERLERSLARLRRDHRKVAVLYGDLDRFKPVNDDLGHAAGDAVLVAVADRLSAGTRQTDTVCRYGGDEFLVICEGFSDEGAIINLAERLVADVARPVTVGDRQVEVGLSVGMVVARAVSTEDDLLARADAALYQAKRAGRGQVVVAD